MPEPKFVINVAMSTSSLITWWQLIVLRNGAFDAPRSRSPKWHGAFKCGAPLSRQVSFQAPLSCVAQVGLCCSLFHGSIKKIRRPKSPATTRAQRQHHAGFHGITNSGKYCTQFIHRPPHSLHTPSLPSSLFVSPSLAHTRAPPLRSSHSLTFHATSALSTPLSSSPHTPALHKSCRTLFRICATHTPSDTHTHAGTHKGTHTHTCTTARAHTRISELAHSRVLRTHTSRSCQTCAHTHTARYLALLSHSPHTDTGTRAPLPCRSAFYSRWSIVGDSDGGSFHVLPHFQQPSDSRTAFHIHNLLTVLTPFGHNTQHRPTGFPRVHTHPHTYHSFTHSNSVIFRPFQRQWTPRIKRSAEQEPFHATSQSVSYFIHGTPHSQRLLTACHSHYIYRSVYHLVFTPLVLITLARSH